MDLKSIADQVFPELWDVRNKMQHVRDALDVLFQDIIDQCTSESRFIALDTSLSPTSIGYELQVFSFENEIEKNAFLAGPNRYLASQIYESFDVSLSESGLLYIQQKGWAFYDERPEVMIDCNPYTAGQTVRIILGYMKDKGADTIMDWAYDMFNRLEAAQSLGAPPSVTP